MLRSTPYLIEGCKEGAMLRLLKHYNCAIPFRVSHSNQTPKIDSHKPP